MRKYPEPQDYCIVAYFEDKILAWGGRYGWRDVPLSQPNRINGCCRYTTREAASRALTRMRHHYSRIFMVAVITQVEKLWVGDKLNLPLISRNKVKVIP
jgi:hypothetical protein